MGGVSKMKEKTSGRSQGEKNSHNCSHLSALWGCWQDSAGQHFSESEQREQRTWGTQQTKLRGQHATIFCIQVLCINAGGGGVDQLLQKRSEALFESNFKDYCVMKHIKYILVLVSNLKWWIKYLWTTGMFLHQMALITAMNLNDSSNYSYTKKLFKTAKYLSTGKT